MPPGKQINGIMILQLPNQQGRFGTKAPLTVVEAS